MIADAIVELTIRPSTMARGPCSPDAPAVSMERLDAIGFVVFIGVGEAIEKAVSSGPSPTAYISFPKTTCLGSFST